MSRGRLIQTNSTSEHGEAPDYQTIADPLRIVVAVERSELEGGVVALEDLDGDRERMNGSTR